MLSRDNHNAFIGISSSTLNSICTLYISYKNKVFLVASLRETKMLDIPPLRPPSPEKL